MLSEAKHLLFLIENKQKQILRCAQNDIAEEFFRSLFMPPWDGGVNPPLHPTLGHYQNPWHRAGI